MGRKHAILTATTSEVDLCMALKTVPNDPDPADMLAYLHLRAVVSSTQFLKQFEIGSHFLCHVDRDTIEQERLSGSKSKAAAISEKRRLRKSYRLKIRPRRGKVQRKTSEDRIDGYLGGRQRVIGPRWLPQTNQRFRRNGY